MCPLFCAYWVSKQQQRLQKRQLHLSNIELVLPLTKTWADLHDQRVLIAHGFDSLLLRPLDLLPAHLPTAHIFLYAQEMGISDREKGIRDIWTIEARQQRTAVVLENGINHVTRLRSSLLDKYDIVRYSNVTSVLLGLLKFLPLHLKFFRSINCFFSVSITN